MEDDKDAYLYWNYFIILPICLDKKKQQSFQDSSKHKG